MTPSSVITSRKRIDRRVASWRRTQLGRLGLYVAAVCLLAALYYAAAKIGLRLAYLNGAVTALWPPVGVGIAALVLYGPRLWPGIVIGDLLAADYSTPLGTVLGQTVGNTLEVVVAAVLLRRLVGGRSVSTACGMSSRWSAAPRWGAGQRGFGATSLRLGDVIPPHEFGEVWRTWWLSDLSGALVFDAADPHVGDPRARRALAPRPLEGVALLIILALLAELPSQRDVPYVVFPVLIWAALRFGPRGAATALSRRLLADGAQHGAQRRPVRARVDHRQPALQPAVHRRGRADVARARRRDRRARDADAALRANEERLRSVVQSMAEGLIVRDGRRCHQRLQRRG